MSDKPTPERAEVEKAKGLIYAAACEMKEAREHREQMESGYALKIKELESEVERLGRWIGEGA